MKKFTIAGAAISVALIATSTAQAHVSVQPPTAPAGGFTRLDLRVPNETDNATTTKVDLQLPPGFASASYEPVPGWAVKVTKVKLATPIQTDDGPVTEGVGRITWTAKTTKDGIPPGAFEDFGLSVQVPGKAGDALTFKALQTYSNGDVVRWIGAKGSDEPAPVVGVVAPGKEGAAPAASPAPAPASSDSGGGSDTLSVIALVVGALGLIAGVAGLLAARRARGASTAARPVAGATR